MSQATASSRPLRPPTTVGQAAGYSLAQQRLHWLSAVLILSMIPTGTIMARTLDDGLRLALYQVHLLVGWSIVALMVARLVLRFRRRVGPPPGLPLWNRRLLVGVHWAVAFFPLALALSGMAAVLQNDLGPLLQAGIAPPATLDAAQARDAHQIGSYAFLALLVVHVAGVLRYQATRGDALGRMGLRGVRHGGGRRRP
jgi:cytochrome b561